MLIVTNRDLHPRATKGEKRFGKGFNAAGPDELRLATAKRTRAGWKVDIHVDSIQQDGRTVWASETAFLQLQERMRRRKRPCVFFVHGFNNDVLDVLERGRLLERNYDVEVVAFTWPANGRNAALGRAGGVASYKSDKRDALRSVGALDRMFEKLGHYLDVYSARMLRCDQRMTLLMHSMGNYLFKHLLKSSVYQGETSLFDNVVLCAADVNNEGHEAWLDRVSYRRRLYVTINEDDSALRMSRAKFGERQQARLGHFTQNLVSHNALYFDFTKARGVGDSHSYFEGDPLENARVKRTFRRMLRGERAEDGIPYNVQARAYRL